MAPLRLQAAITDGDVSAAASMAQELARIAAVVPSLQRPERLSSALSASSLSLSLLSGLSGLAPPRPDSPGSPNSLKAYRESTSLPRPREAAMRGQQRSGATPTELSAHAGAVTGGGGGPSPSSWRSLDAAAPLASSDEECAPGDAATTRSVRLAALQVENAALKRQLTTQEERLRGALLQREGMQLALRRIAEAATLSAGGRDLLTNIRPDAASARLAPGGDGALARAVAAMAAPERPQALQP